MTRGGILAPMSVAAKLQIKPGLRVFVKGDAGPLALSSEVVRVRRMADADVAILFVTKAAEVAALPETLPRITWLAHPKKTSGIASELSRDTGWDALFSRGFVGVASVAIDATWSALRVRPGTDEERAKAAKLRAGMRRPSETRTAKKPPAVLPDDLVRAIGKSAAAKKTAATLAPSHVREYADWITSAKKPETRAARIEKAVAMLAAGQRDRNAAYRG